MDLVADGDRPDVPRLPTRPGHSRVRHGHPRPQPIARQGARHLRPLSPVGRAAGISHNRRCAGRHIVRARGMSQVARDAGLSREALYKAPSPTGNPTLSTLLGVTKALNIRLKASAITAE